MRHPESSAAHGAPLDGRAPVVSSFGEQAHAAPSVGAVALAVAAIGLAYLVAELWWSPGPHARVIVPVIYAVAVVGAAVCVYLVAVRARILDDHVGRWIAAGFAMAGFAAFGQGLVLLDLTPTPMAPTASGAAFLYLVWHAALPAFVVGAVAVPTAVTLRRGALVVFTASVVAAVGLRDWGPLPTLVDGRGTFTSAYDGSLVALVVASAAAAVAWAVRCGRRPTRVQTWVLVALVLSTLDILLASRADRLFRAFWWSSATARGAAFAIPAAGLLADAGRSLRLLHVHERSLAERLQTELEHATSSVAHAVPAADAEARIRAALEPGGIRCRYQPIYSLATGDLVAVEALARFRGPPDRSPDRWFTEAHAVGLGVELELAAVAAALRGAEPLPFETPLTLNVSPEVLLRDELTALLAVHHERQVILEVTEHAAVDDYQQLADAITALRERGVRLAIDDAGAGFASMRHIVRLVPDVIKLDMTLTRAIHLDPVRRSLAASLVTFADQIGALLVAEGVEHPDELATWKDLGAHAAQGYLLGRPGDLPVATASDLVPLRTETGLTSPGM